MSTPFASAEASETSFDLEYFFISITARALKLKFEDKNNPACLRIILVNSFKLKLSHPSYCSRQKAGIAVGPSLTLPSVVTVK